MLKFAPVAVLALIACNGDPTPVPTSPTVQDTAPPTPEPLVVTPNTATALEPGGQASFDVSGVDPAKYYRVTLVSGDLITVAADGSATFQDSGAGTANAGPSDATAGLFHIHYGTLPALAKTFPAGTDDPAAPTGISPLDDLVSFGVEGVDGGTVYPVIYENTGASTFLEIDASGSPIETYVVGPAITVSPLPGIAVAPSTPTTIAAGATTDYTITGLDDTYAYRITLVVADNVTAPGDGTGTFVDGGAGTANAGNSQDYALITAYNGTNDVTPGAKTIPDPADDPAAPTGIFPTGGQITVTIEGVAAGTVVPVAYRNGGTSTFLEIDGNGAPVEDYAVGGALTVQ